jgi:hypothetical protein
MGGTLLKNIIPVELDKSLVQKASNFKTEVLNFENCYLGFI